MKLCFGAIAVAGLTACAPVPQDPYTSNESVGDAPYEDADDIGVAGESGLVEREPDTCGAEELQTVLGQNAAIVPGLGLVRPVRIVQPDDIVTQEYNPMRVNFSVNASGTILRVACG